MSERRYEAETTRRHAPSMPDGFTDRAAWDAIHWCFSENGSLLDEAVIGWQRANQQRVKAAAEAANELFERRNVQRDADNEGLAEDFEAGAFYGGCNPEPSQGAHGNG